MVTPYGYQEDPPDRLGAVRVRTHGQVRLSVVPREALQRTMETEFGALRFPGLYLLLDKTSRQTYVGESADLKTRLRQHLDRPPAELAHWDSAVLIGDGRPMLHSILNDATVRQFLERGLIDPIRSGGHEVTNKVGQPPELNLSQQATAQPFADELLYALSRHGLARQLPPTPPQDEIPLEEIKLRLEEKAHSVSRLGAYEAQINAKPAFVRPGSLKPRGWQITLRNAFRESVRDSDGYILVNRGRGLLIPFQSLRTFLGNTLNQKTVDIFITFESETAAKIRFKKAELDASEFLL